MVIFLIGLDGFDGRLESLLRIGCSRQPSRKELTVFTNFSGEIRSGLFGQRSMMVPLDQTLERKCDEDSQNHSEQMKEKILE